MSTTKSSASDSIQIPASNLMFGDQLLSEVDGETYVVTIAHVQRKWEDSVMFVEFTRDGIHMDSGYISDEAMVTVLK